MSLNEASAKDRLNLFKLEDDSHYLRWQAPGVPLQEDPQRQRRQAEGLRDPRQQVLREAPGLQGRLQAGGEGPRGALRRRRLPTTLQGPRHGRRGRLSRLGVLRLL